METPKKQTLSSTVFPNGLPSPPDDGLQSKDYVSEPSPTSSPQLKPRSGSKKGYTLHEPEPQPSTPATVTKSPAPSNGSADSDSGHCQISDELCSKESSFTTTLEPPSTKASSSRTSSSRTSSSKTSSSKVAAPNRPNKTLNGRRAVTSPASLPPGDDHKGLIKNKDSIKNKTITSSLVDGYLYDKIKSPWRQPGLHKTEGRNYVFAVPFEEKLLVKLGRTENKLQQRLQQIQSGCGLKNIKILNESCLIVEHFEVAEGLIHVELQNFRYLFKCKKCPNIHKEYFTVDTKFALEVTNRWVSFVAKKPWGDDGKLRPFWEDRFKKRPLATDDMDHEALSNHWEVLLNPTSWDMMFFTVMSIWKVASVRPWQWISLLEAFYVYFRLPGSGTLLFLVLLMAAMLIERDFSPDLFPGGSSLKPASSPGKSPGKKATSPKENDVSFVGHFVYKLS